MTDEPDNDRDEGLELLAVVVWPGPQPDPREEPAEPWAKRDGPRLELELRDGILVLVERERMWR